MKGALLSIAIAAIASRGAAQIAEPAAVEETPSAPAHVRGEGRGFLYGAHVTSAAYLTRVAPVPRSAPGAGPREIWVGSGVGLTARLGWEIGSGLAIEIPFGLAANGVDTMGAMREGAFLRFDVGAAARYSFFNPSIVVPFVQVGFGAHFFHFSMPWTSTPPQKVDLGTTLGVGGALGIHLEIAPFFGIEAGAQLDVAFGLDTFQDALVWITPFVGVTLYAM